MGLLIPIAVLPTDPILRLSLKEYTYVVDDVITQSSNELAIAHISPKTSTRPIPRAIPATVPIVARRHAANKQAPATKTKQVTHAPAEALNAVAAVIDGNAAGPQIVCSGNVVVVIRPTVLQLCKLRGISVIAGMPGVVQVVAKLRECAISTRSALQIPAVVRAKHGESAVLGRVVVVDGLQESTKVVAVVELEVAHGVIVIAPAQTLVVVLTALPSAEVEHLVSDAPGRDRLGGIGSNLIRTLVKLGGHGKLVRVARGVLAHKDLHAVIRDAIEVRECVRICNGREAQRKPRRNNRRHKETLRRLFVKHNAPGVPFRYVCLQTILKD